MEEALLLDCTTLNGTSVHYLVACKDWRSPCLVLDLRLDIIDSVTRLDLKGHFITRRSLNEDFHPPSQSQHWATNHEFLSSKHSKKYTPRWRVDSFWIL